MERANNEFCYTLSSHWKLNGGDGSEYEAEAGHALYLGQDWKGTSHSIESINKSFMPT